MKKTILLCLIVLTVAACGGKQSGNEIDAKPVHLACDSDQQFSNETEWKQELKRILCHGGGFNVDRTGQYDSSLVDTGFCGPIESRRMIVADRLYLRGLTPCAAARKLME